MWNSKEVVGTMLQTDSQGHHSLSLSRLVFLPTIFFCAPLGRHQSGLSLSVVPPACPPPPETGPCDFNLFAGPHEKYKCTLNTCVLVPGLAPPKNESHMRFGMIRGSVNGEIIKFDCPFNTEGIFFIVLTVSIVSFVMCCQLC